MTKAQQVSRKRRHCKPGLTLALSLAVSLLAACPPPADAVDLQKVVQQADDSFRVEIVEITSVGSCKAIVCRLTSHKWRGKEWQHWLALLVPQKIDQPDKAILFVSGGSRNSNAPKGDSSEALLLALLATQTRCPIAVLGQVPNQPLYDNLSEDPLIAYTFDQFLNGGDDDWPLLIPMVTSAVRAMDAVQQIGQQELDLTIKQFIVSGASKRGWTSWLTAAVDRRVVGVAPMVIDMLNMKPQMEHQLRSYGEYSEMIKPYTHYKIPARIASKRGKQLTRIVDPYEYRQLLTMPKLVVLGTNDPYWTVDASRFYFQDLKGPSSLFYLPNAGHGLGIGIVPTVSAFFKATLAGKKLPAMTWRLSDENVFRVDWESQPRAMRLWHTHSENRDFRSAQWSSTNVVIESQFTQLLKQPAEGWDAWYLEVEFPDDNLVYSLTSGIQVLPRRLPFKLPGQTPAEPRRKE